MSHPVDHAYLNNCYCLGPDGPRVTLKSKEKLDRVVVKSLRLGVQFETDASRLHSLPKPKDHAPSN
ncbi:hypothetical protein LJY25_14850 [Hymenobacter sp. BT175]|uniref:hypothetical protein n=1 Tax=Hymenobacter translucens TaxID=2886507 RepID=UPI001D0EED49|nr:hypothetical protein [Hymenobacter translucens]MCC2547732.1 hypothetical protein [Hymenobacter translucens]